jgi:hypothetical protein
MRRKITPSERLVLVGWRQIGSRGSIKFWDHPEHQPAERGAFTTTDALEHQIEVEMNCHCDCIKPESE